MSHIYATKYSLGRVKTRVSVNCKLSALCEGIYDRNLIFVWLQIQLGIKQLQWYTQNLGKSTFEQVLRSSIMEVFQSSKILTENSKVLYTFLFCRFSLAYYSVIRRNHFSSSQGYFTTDLNIFVKLIKRGKNSQERTAFGRVSQFLSSGWVGWRKSSLIFFAQRAAKLHRQKSNFGCTSMSLQLHFSSNIDKKITSGRSGALPFKFHTHTYISKKSSCQRIYPIAKCNSHDCSMICRQCEKY